MAEKNAELIEEVKASRRSLEMAQKEYGGQIANLERMLEDQEAQTESRLRELSKLYETRLEETRKSASQQVELVARESEIKARAKDQEYQNDVTSKLSVEKTKHATEVSVLRAEIAAKSKELMVKDAAMEKLESEFRVLSTQVVELQQRVKAAEDGILLREQVIRQERNQLDALREKSTSELERIRSMTSAEAERLRSEATTRLTAATERINSLTLQLAAKEKQLMSEMASAQATSKAECDATVARLAEDSTRRLQDTEHQMKQAFDSRLREILIANAQQQRALIERYKNAADADKAGCTIV